MPPAGTRIAVAMSGGVDSAAAAARLVGQGYECIGLTLRLMQEPEQKYVFEPCCGLKAAEDARRICDRLGMDHRVIHAVDRFEQDIIRHFARGYHGGRTPNPCIRCNRMIKFGWLFRQARHWGCECVAMGHYARLVACDARLGLRRAAFREKDQTYVLAPLSQAQLRRACFPLGTLSKEQARAIARELDIEVGNKKESQEICFVADRQYARVVEQRHGAGEPGPIRDLSGRILGRHRGLHCYTIGQRKGMGISAPEPLFVVRLEADTNTLYVGRAAQTYAGEFMTGPLHYGALPPQEHPFRAMVQLRYRHEPVPAQVIPRERDTRVLLGAPQRAVTPGQWAVFYDVQGTVLASAEIRSFTVLNVCEHR